MPKKRSPKCLDATVSFKTAVRHFFRYLHNAAQLQRNPITARFFEDLSIGGSGLTRDQAVVVRIHELLFKVAEDLLNADREAGRGQRGLRQYTIIRSHYLLRRSLAEIAAELQISTSVFYRERSEICLRVASGLLHNSGIPTVQYRPDIDDFSLRLERARRVATFGDEASSYREFDAVRQAAESGAQSIQALCGAVEIALRFGNVRRAQRGVSTVREIFKAHFQNEILSGSAIALSRIELCEAAIADRLRAYHQAVELSASATYRLRSLQKTEAPAAVDLYIECLTSLAAALWNVGDIEPAYDALFEADAAVCQKRAASRPLSVGIALWRVRNRLLVSARTWYPAWKRIHALQELFDTAYEAGWLIDAIQALQGISEIHAFSGNDFEAMRSGRLLVALANRQGSARVQNSTALAVAQALLRTHYSAYALRLISEVEQRAGKDTTLEPRLSSVITERAIFLRQFKKGWQLASAQQEPDPTEFGLGRRIIRARLAHELGYRAESATEVEALLPLAVRYGSAPVLMDAYQIAARVTLKPEYRKKATEVLNLLSA